MPMFTKKKIPTECHQWLGHEADLDGFLPLHADRTNSEGELNIITLEGALICTVGSWICRGVKGEFWAIKPDIFAETYEPYKEPPTGGSREELYALVDLAKALLDASKQSDLAQVKWLVLDLRALCTGIAKVGFDLEDLLS